MGEDGGYHDLGLTAPIGVFPRGSRAENRLRVTPTICPECFEALRACVAAGEPAGLAVA